MSQGHWEVPRLISTQSAQSTQEQSGSKEPPQVQGDCSCLPNLPGVGGEGRPRELGCCTSNMVLMSEYLDFISSPQEVRLQ